MKKSFWLTGLVLLMSLLTNIGYANDTIRWTWQMKYTDQNYGFNFAGTEDGAFAVDWGDGEVTEVAGNADYYGVWLTHEYAETGSHAVRLYALTADADITYLGITYVSLTSLDASACPSLERLVCYNNRLTSLDVSGCTALTELYCHNNQLTSLDVSGCTALANVLCYNNQMSFRTVAEMALALSSEQLDWGNERKFTPQIHERHLLKPGGTVAVPELPVIKGTRAHLDVYRNGIRVVNQGYTVEDGQLHFTEIGEYKLVVWHDSVQEYRYVYDEDGYGSYRFTPYGDTTYVGVYEEYVSGHDMACYSYRKSRYDNYEVSVGFMGTAGESFVIDWGDGDRTVAIGTGEMETYRHRYDAETVQIKWRLYGMAATARITGLSKQYGWGEVYDNQSVLDLGVCPGLTHLTWTKSRLASLDISRNPELTHLDCSDNRLTSLNVAKHQHLTYLNCSHNSLKSLNVTKNTALLSLDCGSNSLTTLDVSKNMALKKLDCRYNNLSSLDVSKNGKLEVLSCYNNQLTTLDVSKNEALMSLDCGSNSLTTLDVSKNMELTSLDCPNNGLTSLDVSAHKALKYLGCHNNNIADIRLDGCEALLYLTCYSNALSALDIAGTSLESIDAKYNAFSLQTVADIEANMPMEISDGNKYVYFYPQNRPFVLQPEGGLDLSDYIPTLQNEPSHWFVFAGTDTLQAGIDYTLSGGKLSVHTPGMYWLQVWHDSVFDGRIYNRRPYVAQYGLGVRGETEWGNDVARLTWQVKAGQKPYFHLSGDCGFVVDWGDGSKTAEFGLEGNTVLQISHAYAKAGTYRVAIYNGMPEAHFERLDCGNQSVTALDVTGCPHLEYLGCYDNRLAVLDVSKNVALRGLDCRYNNLSSLDVSKNVALEWLECYFNNLSSLDVSKNVALEDLECHFNKLTSLDVSKNIALVDLYCHYNALTTLEVSGLPELSAINCCSNRLTSLSVKDCPALQSLGCSDNQLTSLDIEGSPDLYALMCRKNQFQTLDVSGYPHLRYLGCSENNLSTLDLSANPELGFLDCAGNHMTLSTLSDFRATLRPTMAEDLDELGLSPQRIAVKVPVGGVLDLSSEMQLEDVETEVDFGDMAEDAYTFADGRVQFNKAGTREIRLSNAAMRNTVYSYVLVDDNGLEFEYDFDWDIRMRDAVTEVFYEVTVGDGIDPDVPSDTTANEAALAAAPFAYVQGHMVYLADGLGEVEALTVMGQRVYKGSDRAIMLPRHGVYIMRVVTDGRRCKVIVR